jgi:hypothetical protein
MMEPATDLVAKDNASLATWSLQRRREWVQVRRPVESKAKTTTKTKRTNE